MHTEIPIRVWVVEDNPSFRHAVLQEINESEGMRCDRAFDSCESLLTALDEESHPAVILLDIRLHGLSGIAAIAAVKSRAPNTEILMLTMFADQDRIVRALCAGASGYLLKSSHESIPTAIRQAVNGGAPLSPTIARSILNLFTRITPPQPNDDLSSWEKSILELMVQGLPKTEIAQRLLLSENMVSDCLKKIYRRLHLSQS